MSEESLKWTVDGFNPNDPRHIEQCQEAIQLSKERYGNLIPPNITDAGKWGKIVVVVRGKTEAEYEAVPLPLEELISLELLASGQIIEGVEYVVKNILGSGFAHKSEQVFPGGPFVAEARRFFSPMAIHSVTFLPGEEYIREEQAKQGQSSATQN